MSDIELVVALFLGTLLLASLAEDGSYPDEAVTLAREGYEMRIARAEGEAGEADGDFAHGYHELRQKPIAAEREELNRLRSQRAVHWEALRELQRELDVEAGRLD